MEIGDLGFGIGDARGKKHEVRNKRRIKEWRLVIWDLGFGI
jgi:hypothetical protein